MLNAIQLDSIQFNSSMCCTQMLCEYVSDKIPSIMRQKKEWKRKIRLVKNGKQKIEYTACAKDVESRGRLRSEDRTSNN